jgi:hypothetical protein
MQKKKRQKTGIASRVKTIGAMEGWTTKLALRAEDGKQRGDGASGC